MHKCLIAGIDSPLRGAVSLDMESLGFEVLHARSRMRAHALLCQGGIDALVIIDEEREKSVRLMSEYGNGPKVIRGVGQIGKVTDSGHELVGLLDDRTPGGHYPRTLVIETDRPLRLQRVQIRRASFVGGAWVVDATLLEKLFHDILPPRQAAVA
jgi:hypothetical protein